MIAEALNKIEKWVKDRLGSEIIHLPGDPDHVHYVKNANGMLNQLLNKPGPRVLNLESLGDLILLAHDHFDKVKDEDGASKVARPVCVHNFSEVRLYWDYENLREYASVVLHPTAEYDFFSQRAEDPTIGAKALATAMRFEIDKTLPHATLADQVGKMSVTINKASEQHHQRHSESMGSVVLSQVEGVGDLPANVQNFNVRAYTNWDIGERCTLKCHLEPDLGSQSWFLKPMETSLIAYHQHFERLLCDRLIDGLGVGEPGEQRLEVPIYHGTLSMIERTDKARHEVTDTSS